MSKKIKCRICNQEIVQDRYNVTLVLERQDFPGESEWQKSTPVCLENICFKCQRKLVHGFRNLLRDELDKSSPERIMPPASQSKT